MLISQNSDILISLPIGALSVHLDIVDGSTSIASATAPSRKPRRLINSFKRLPPLLISLIGYFNHIAFLQIRIDNLANLQDYVILMTLPVSD